MRDFFDLGWQITKVMIFVSLCGFLALSAIVLVLHTLGWLLQ